MPGFRLSINPKSEISERGGVWGEPSGCPCAFNKTLKNPTFCSRIFIGQLVEKVFSTS